MSRIRIRRGTAAAWTSANPTLALGEPGYETDTGKLKVGDGSTAWTSLPYFGGGGGGGGGGAAELDYAERTSAHTITSTTEGTPDNVLSGAAITVDGSTRIRVEVCFPWMSATNAVAAFLNLWDGGTDIGRLVAVTGQVANGNMSAQVAASRFLTPSNGSHTYHVKAWKTGGTCFVQAGAGGAAAYIPGFLRVTEA